MRLYKIFCFVSVLAFGLSGCSDEFLDRYPLDQISSMDYWKTTQDLELYVNQFYPTAFNVSGSDRYESIFQADLSSDDMVPVQVDKRLQGTRVVPASGGWNYTPIRSLNYFLENYQHVEAD